MRIKKGDGVLIRDNQGEFSSGYFRGFNVLERGRAHVFVETETRKDVSVLASSVYVFYKSMPRPLLPAGPFATVRQRVLNSSSSRRVKVQPKVQPVQKLDRYARRKHEENLELVSDCRLLLGVPLSEVHLLTLDDLRPGTGVPNTLKTWVDSGGRADRVYVPNPRPDVCEQVEKSGGHARPVTLANYIMEKTLPPFEALYLDFCGFFSTVAEDVEAIFVQHQRLLADEGVLHLTTCRREKGSDTMIERIVLPTLQKWARESGYGVVLLKRTWKSSTMVKGAFYLKRIDPLVGVTATKLVD